MREFVDILASARRLNGRLAALPELRMRRSALADWMRAADLDELVEVLAHILHRRAASEPPYHAALLALVSVLDSDDDLPYARRRELYAHAKRCGHLELARLFLSSAPRREGEARGQQLEVRGRALTLGERKWLARSSRRELLDRLRADPDPQVIRHLLANPRITEPDVIAIAARRPTNPDVQREIFAARRWGNRYRVLRTLVLNPYTPIDLTMRLLAFLRQSDRRLVAEDSELPAVVREIAAGDPGNGDRTRRGREAGN